MTKQKAVYRKAKVFYESPYHVDFKGGGMPPGGFYDLVVKYKGEETEYLPSQTWPELGGRNSYAVLVEFGGNVPNDDVKLFQRNCEELSDKILKVELEEYPSSLWRRVREYIREMI
ncbi:MAG: hypothetical protein AABW48_02905 [Nanoarchaeota archaeon]